MVVTPGMEASFICRVFSDDGQLYNWLVNGTQLEEINLGDRVEEFGSHHIRILVLLDVSVEYNDTTILTSNIHMSPHSWISIIF